MARGQQQETVDNSQLLSDLIADTQFNFINQGDIQGTGSLSDKPKVETPVVALNNFLGGGLPLGSMIEVFGPNAAGKSSLMYETLGNFQRTYPNGVAFIIDTETSSDDSRLRRLGVDVTRAPRMGAATLEDGFEQINKILKKMINNPAYKGFPVMILWDTIAAAPSRAQLAKEDMYAGGMAERARIIKSSLMTLFPLIEKQNVLIVLLNQVMAEIGGFRPGLTSGGGNALAHDIHMRLEVMGGKTEYDGPYAVSKYSNVSIAKSKVSPLMNNFPVMIDITKGGVVDREGSLVWWMVNLTNPNVFKIAAWSSLEDWVYQKYKPYWDKFPEFASGKFRQAMLYELARNNPNFMDLLQLIWIDLISDKYTLQGEVCQAERVKVDERLKANLGLTDADFAPPQEIEEVDTSVSSDALDDLANAFNVDTSTGEVQ